MAFRNSPAPPASVVVKAPEPAKIAPKAPEKPAEAPAPVIDPKMLASMQEVVAELRAAREVAKKTKAALAEAVGHDEGAKAKVDMLQRKLVALASQLGGGVDDNVVYVSDDDAVRLAKNAAAAKLSVQDYVRAKLVG